MNDLIFDDIGSYPLPQGVTKEWVQKAFSKHSEREKLFQIINAAFQQKVDAGVEAPTYPQYQDMNEQFLSVIRDPENTEEPFKVKEKAARILELEAVQPAAQMYMQSHGEKQNTRVCVTGPLEMYLKEFGGTEYTDILYLLAESVDRFLKNSIENSGYLNISVVSIDEPSIGINPQVMFDDDELIQALKIATRSAHRKGIDVQIHLHSPLHYKLACDTSQINVIGVESAGHPSYLDLIDKRVLDESDSFLRVGIARTDISNLVSVLNDKYGTNVWKDPSRIQEIVTGLETPDVIAKRLEKAYSIFGERIKYVGPDCGLGSWPSQQIASQLLQNVAAGMQKSGI
ncbi:MAG: 5-methyltetrahydropteroyltriglutamate--homocysteine methyltransferase [Methanomethylovorans sp. PtaU1.Bin093]|uniref:methionine synthase n=1 Tax=Methanomethylovorans sp. PtaU1.Bin093 TaxID=1811679 RepID=UPI0009D6062B|nr:methionine synthase [Methanomethylovorans sp. PtaU1.Bin093]OPY20999.1 MAG: 5-methyltetrahydropteroyltriglutamate--homocysteine methyltransferase [Methanomethylovorans sp. PtaU1.Bin093]